MICYLVGSRDIVAKILGVWHYFVALFGPGTK